MPPHHLHLHLHLRQPCLPTTTSTPPLSPCRTRFFRRGSRADRRIWRSRGRPRDEEVDEGEERESKDDRDHSEVFEVKVGVVFADMGGGIGKGLGLVKAERSTSTAQGQRWEKPSLNWSWRRVIKERKTGVAMGGWGGSGDADGRLGSGDGESWWGRGNHYERVIWWEDWVEEDRNSFDRG